MLGLSLSIKLPGEVESTESAWIQTLRQYEKIEDERLKHLASELFRESLSDRAFSSAECSSSSSLSSSSSASSPIQVLFLDVDGVLIPVCQNSEFPCELQCQKFARVLEKCPKLKIVVSSSWRKTRHTLYLLLAALQESGIDVYNRVIGSVPFDHLSEATIAGRTRDVTLWFRELRVHPQCNPAHCSRRSLSNEFRSHTSSLLLFQQQKRRLVHTRPSISSYHSTGSLSSCSDFGSVGDAVPRPGLVLSDKSASVSEIVDSQRTTVMNVMNDDSLFHSEVDSIEVMASSPWIRSNSETSVGNLSDVTVDHAESPPSEKPCESTTVSSTSIDLSSSMMMSDRCEGTTTMIKSGGLGSRADAARTISVDSSGADADLDDESDLTDCSALSSASSSGVPSSHSATMTTNDDAPSTRVDSTGTIFWVSEIPGLSLVISDYLIIDDLNLNKHRSSIVNDHFLHTETDVGLTDLHCDLIVRRFGKTKDNM